MTTWSILHRDSCPCREKGCPVDARRDPCWTKGCVLVEVLDAPKGTVVEDLTVTPVDESHFYCDARTCDINDAECPKRDRETDEPGYEDRGLDAHYEDRYDR